MGVKQDILVILDHFTKLGQAIMTRDQTAKSVARPLWNDFFMIYGFPKHILTDQGRDFESTLIREICKLASITKCRTTPYHPAGNPVERWNRTLIGMLRSLEEERKYDWRRYLKHVVHAYNCRIHESTGYSPFYLFFGHQPRLPIDLVFGIDLDKGRGGSPSQYIKALKESLKKAYDLARNNMACSASQNKRRYDVGAKAAELELGDRVLVRKMGPRIKPKVDDRWEPAVYRVMSKKTELPVYGVQKENGEGPLRILHRNLLLPIGVLESPPEEPDEQDELQPRTRRKNQPKVLAEAAGEEDADPEWAEPIDIKVTVAPGAQMPAMQPAVMEVQERADEVQEESSGGGDEDTDGAMLD